MLIGYASVSTPDQDLSSQRTDLIAVGCSKIFAEKIKGNKRPELIKLLDHLRLGDVVIVTRLDRFSHNTRGLLKITEKIQSADAGFRSLAEPWADTTAPAGKMILTIFAGLAEFEREFIRKRTKKGRAAALARGVKFGPPPVLSQEQIKQACDLVEKGCSVAYIASQLGVHRSTIYRALQKLRMI